MSLLLYKNRFKNYLSLNVLAISLSFRKTDAPERCIFISYFRNEQSEVEVTTP